MSQIPRPALVAAITNVLRRGGIQEPQLMASMCATAVLDAISVFESIQNAPAPGSPDDLSVDDFVAPARSPISLPQPVLESVPAPRPQLVIAPDQAKQEPPPVAIRPNRAGKPNPGDGKNWKFDDLRIAVMGDAPATIEVGSGTGVLTLTRSVDADEALGIVKLSFTANGSTTSDVKDAVSLGPIMVSHPFTVYDKNPIDLKFVLLDLRNKAAGMIRTRSGGPVVSRNVPVTTSQAEAFSDAIRDMGRHPEQRKFAGNFDEV